MTFIKIQNGILSSSSTTVIPVRVYQTSSVWIEPSPRMRIGSISNSQEHLSVYSSGTSVTTTSGTFIGISNNNSGSGAQAGLRFKGDSVVKGKAAYTGFGDNTGRGDLFFYHNNEDSTNIVKDNNKIVAFRSTGSLALCNLTGTSGIVWQDINGVFQSRGTYIDANNIITLGMIGSLSPPSGSTGSIRIGHFIGTETTGSQNNISVGYYAGWYDGISSSYLSQSENINITLNDNLPNEQGRYEYLFNNIVIGQRISRAITGSVTTPYSGNIFIGKTVAPQHYSTDMIGIGSDNSRAILGITSSASSSMGIAIGANAVQQGTLTSYDYVCIGFTAGGFSTFNTSSNSIYIGANAGKAIGANSFSRDSIGIGVLANGVDTSIVNGVNDGVSNRSISIGLYAGLATRGSDNISIGFQAGQNMSGSNNINFGTFAGYETSTNTYNSINIGRANIVDLGNLANLRVGRRDCIGIGNFISFARRPTGSIYLGYSTLRDYHNIATTFDYELAINARSAGTDLASRNPLVYGNIFSGTVSFFNSCSVGQLTPLDSLHVYSASAGGTMHTRLANGSDTTNSRATQYFSVGTTRSPKASIVFNKTDTNSRGDLYFSLNTGSNANIVSSSTDRFMHIEYTNAGLGLGYGITADVNSNLFISGSQSGYIQLLLSQSNATHNVNINKTNITSSTLIVSGTSHEQFLINHSGAAGGMTSSVAPFRISSSFASQNQASETVVTIAGLDIEQYHTASFLSGSGQSAILSPINFRRIKTINENSSSLYGIYAKSTALSSTNQNTSSSYGIYLESGYYNYISGTLTVGTETNSGSNLFNSGSLASKTSLITSNYTASANDNTFLVSASSTQINIELPNASNCVGRIYRFNKIDNSGQTLIISGVSAQTIDGSTGVSTITQYDTYKMVSNGSNWFLL